MKTILAIDPGPVQSGFVRFAGTRVLESGLLPNDEMLQKTRCAIGHLQATDLAIEMIASYGMPVGREVFETCVWIGRFQQVWTVPEHVRLVYRRDVKLHLCGTAKAKDPNVRASLIDRFGPGRELAVGTKKNPGPLYGVTSHAWAALAVAVTVIDAA